MVNCYLGSMVSAKYHFMFICVLYPCHVCEWTEERRCLQLQGWNLLDIDSTE